MGQHLVKVGDRIQVSINGAPRNAVVLFRSTITGSVIIALDRPYSSGRFESWSPVSKNKPALVALCYRNQVNPYDKVCWNWIVNDGMTTLERITSSDVDTLRTIPVAASVPELQSQPEIAEGTCRNRTCQKKNSIGQKSCWWCGITNPC